MKNKLIVLGIVVVVILLAIIGFIIRDTGKSVNPSPQALTALPVIQILKPSVFVLDESHKIVRELKDKDALIAPIKIRTSEAADATIVYPDGSSARLSPGTELTLDQGSYDPQTGTIHSQIFLILGHVWSKVVSLATPQSQWEVQTAHAVATVRGTAFDTKVKDGQTTFTGSEHNVDIVPIDPDTKKAMFNKHALLGEKMRMVLEDKTNKRMSQSDDQIYSEMATSSNPEDRDWIGQNRGRDAVLDDLQKENKTDIRDEMFKEKDRFEHAESMEDTPSTPNQSSQPKEIPKTTVPVVVPERAVKVSDVKIRMDIPDPLIERTQVQYTVVAILDSGAERDITREAKTRVEGGIGKILQPGVFVGELAPDKTELGSSFGALLGTWTDETGKTFEFNTKPFSVKLFIEEQVDTRG
jgi:hypothetical protein